MIDTTKLRRGQIGFATNTHAQISKLIRWFTRSRWSHTFVITDRVSENGHVYLLEANEFGTDYRRMEEYIDSATDPFEIWEAIDDTLPVDPALIETEKKFVGMIYGYLELFGIAFKILMARAGLRVHDPIKQGAVCSQDVWFYLNKYMSGTFDSLNEFTVSPEDLYQIVTRSGKFRRVL